MNTFENKVCPLCGNVLTFKVVAGVNVYACPTNFEFHSPMGTQLKTHYELEIDKVSSYQHMYILPWAIDNFGNSPKSRVYKVEDYHDDDGIHFQKWKLVTEVPQIHEDTEQNLRARLNTLLTFL